MSGSRTTSAPHPFAALFTGRYPHQNGVHGLVMDVTGGFDLAHSPWERHLVNYLSAAGYQSVLIGGMHESRFPTRLRFDAHDWHQDIRQTPPTMDAWLTSRQRDRPFYIQVGSWMTHRDSDGAGWTDEEVEPDDSKGVWAPPYLKESDQLRREMARPYLRISLNRVLMVPYSCAKRSCWPETGTKES
ncbi:MAG: hypothetical protein QGI68_05840 [Pseudomonadales bacterium]|nr:hypothetical protein [Arenicellales bacterium]MDP7595075.1 hypothetical protein [Pseudomonadales bacterium]